jgi:hypothetical protein
LPFLLSFRLEPLIPTAKFFNFNLSHPQETVSSTDIDGPGTFMDKSFVPAPQDAARLLEYIAKRTPGFTQTPEIGTQ